MRVGQWFDPLYELRFLWIPARLKITVFTHTFAIFPSLDWKNGRTRLWNEVKTWRKTARQIIIHQGRGKNIEDRSKVPSQENDIIELNYLKLEISILRKNNIPSGRLLVLTKRDSQTFPIVYIKAPRESVEHGQQTLQEFLITVYKKQTRRNSMKLPAAECNASVSRFRAG